MKIYILKLGFATFWGIYSFLLTNPDDPDSGDDPPWENQAPIDHWVLLLMFVAAALGIYFLLKAKQKPSFSRPQD